MAGDRAQVLAAAAAFEREGRLGEAERLYRALLAADGGDFETLLRLGAVKIELGDISEGERIVRHCATFDLAPPPFRARLAAAFLALRQFDNAIAQAKKALAADPRLVDAHIILGSAFQALKRYDEAIESYRNALALDPDLVAAHFNLATVFQALDRHDDAIACYERVIAADPDNVEAQYGIGTALVASDRGAKAITLFEHALATDPDFAEAAVALARVLQSLGRHEDAVSRYRQALDVDPDYIDARGGLATALQALGKYLEAIAAFEAVGAAEPDNPIGARAFESYRAQGLAYVKIRRFEAAFDCYEKALRLHPDDAITHGLFGFALSAAGKSEEAVARYRQALALDPDDADIQLNYGAVLIQTGRIEEARRVYERVMALRPELAAPYVALTGLQRMTVGDPIITAMEQLLETSEVQTGPDALKLHFGLGKAYGDIGNAERSFHHFTAANELKRRDITYDETAALRSYSRIRHMFERNLIRSKAGSGDLSIVPIFILGHPRSGTTLVEQMLASHPNVFGGGERTDLHEIVAHYCPQYPDGMPWFSSDALTRLGTHYVANLVRSAPGAARITDKAPGNFAHIGLIRLALPNAHIIHVCRDPVDTCLSCFANLFDGNAVPYSYDLAELGRHYRAYAALMEHWRQVLPAGVMLDVRYEDVVANFEQEARRIVGFCGLPWDDACLAFHKTERMVRTASVLQVRQPIYQSSVGRARPPGDLLQPLLDALG